MLGFLYIISTPIGNLEDLTFRALRVLKEVDLILCEDTRVTKRLLGKYGIKKETLSYHQHSRLEKIKDILKILERGKNLALVSDAGTPGISDPGNQLIQYLISQFPGIKIIPIPGPSALTALASISGFPMDRFIFLGFPPHKKGREKFFKEVSESKYPVIFYESPYRILKTLDQLEFFVKDRPLIIGRELTKKFETIYRGKIKDIKEKIERDKIRGEFTVIVGKEQAK